MSLFSTSAGGGPGSVRPLRLREAHAHLHALGESLELGSLAGCASMAEVLAKVEGACRGGGGGSGDEGGMGEGERRVVRFTSARVSAWPEGRWPTMKELDAASRASAKKGEPAAAVVIMSFDHHCGVANSAAMEAAFGEGFGAGPTGGVPGEPAGEIVADGAGGPSGLLMEGAIYSAWGLGAGGGGNGATAVGSPVAQRRRVKAALAHLAALGFVEVHDLHSQPWLGPVLAEMERASELSMRVTLFVPAARLAAEAAMRAAWESERITLGGGKVFADGTLNARTALMIHRYAEPVIGHPRGQAMVSPAALDEYYRTADSLGLPLAVHAIGDCAVRMTLDCIERVVPKATGQRIEHCEVIDKQDVPRFAKMGVICSVQPCHLLYDVEALERHLPHRLDRVLPLRELVDAGCKPGELLWMGSDVPIVPADPEDSVRAAVARRRGDMEAARAIAPGQALTEDECWACFTPRV